MHTATISVQQLVHLPWPCACHALGGKVHDNLLLIYRGFKTLVSFLFFSYNSNDSSWANAMAIFVFINSFKTSEINQFYNIAGNTRVKK